MYYLELKCKCNFTLKTLFFFSSAFLAAQMAQSNYGLLVSNDALQLFIVILKVLFKNNKL